MKWFSLFVSKLRSSPLTLSVDIMEWIPRRLARRDAKVDFPQPLVPHKSIVTESLLSLILHAVEKSTSCLGLE